jgi:hypothetical protein
MPKGTRCDLSVEELDKAVAALAGLLSELGACPPNNLGCPQRNKSVNISICAKCLRAWAEAKAKGEPS